MSNKVSENSKSTGYWRLREEEQPYVDLMSRAGFRAVFCNPKNKDLLLTFLQLQITDRKIVDVVGYPEATGDWDINIPGVRHDGFKFQCLTDKGELVLVHINLPQSPEELL